MFCKKFTPSRVKLGERGRKEKSKMFSLQKYKESAGFPVCVLSHKAPRALASLRGWRSCELLKVSSRTDRGQHNVLSAG